VARIGHSRRRSVDQARNQMPFGVAQIRLVSLGNPRMLCAGGWGPHANLQDVCKLPELQAGIWIAQAQR
jgi:hypothetical protein